MKLNKEKLDQMVEAVMKLNQSAHKNRLLIEQNTIEQVKTDIATALTPFAMEMTDEEIERESKLYYKPHGSNIDIGSFRKGVYTGARFMRDKDGK